MKWHKYGGQGFTFLLFRSLIIPLNVNWYWRILGTVPNFASRHKLQFFIVVLHRQSFMRAMWKWDQRRPNHHTVIPSKHYQDLNQTSPQWKASHTSMMGRPTAPPRWRIHRNGLYHSQRKRPALKLFCHVINWVYVSATLIYGPSDHVQNRFRACLSCRLRLYSCDVIVM